MLQQRLVISSTAAWSDEYSLAMCRIVSQYCSVWLDLQDVYAETSA